MKPGRRVLTLAVLLLVASPLLTAQDESEAPPMTVGGFQNQGSVTLGYRFTDIKGYRPQFLQLFDLQKGFRLQDFNIFGESQPGVTPLQTPIRSRPAAWEVILTPPRS